MISGLRCLLLSLLLSVSQLGVAQTQASTPGPSPLSSADQLYRAGKFAQAAEKYQEALKQDPTALAAQIGLIRSWLREQKVDEAYAEAKHDLELQPNSAALLAAMGDVQFRRGEMWDAETTYRKALAIDPKQVQAHLGVAQLSDAYSFHRRAYDHLQIAHRLAPDDPEVQSAWLWDLPRKDRLSALEAYLAGTHSEDEEESAQLRQYLDFLKATADKPAHVCRQVNRMESTELKMRGLLRGQKHKLSGSGLTVSVNEHNQRLLLDTGASGILLTPGAADKAGLKVISKINISGLGDDKKAHTGSVAVADQIRIGDLEFHDCLVRVTDNTVSDEEDGLIGADVFRSYLVEIDFPREKLKLSPLPKRPDETLATTNTLNSDGDAQAQSDEGADEKQATAAEAKADTTQTAPPPANSRRLPEDRYVAPEMKNWTSVFRFGHSLLVPTRIDNSPPLLFLIDSGAEGILLSQRTAKQVVGKTYNDPDLQVVGLSGTVKNVYRAETATLHFGHYAQTNQYMVTVDLTKEAKRMGTELSGILGYDLLQLMQLKIDYRDGLVDFVYEAKH